MRIKAAYSTVLILFLAGTLTVSIRILPTESTLPTIDWTHYHSYSEIVTILLALNQTYPNIVDVFPIGKSWQNRDIYCIRLTNESDVLPKPEVFFVGYHHAREPITAELALYFAVHAATSFDTNATITAMLNNSQIYVVVALNVDGFVLFEANDWQRKNARPIDEDFDSRIDEDPPEDADHDGFIEQLINITDPEHPHFVRWEGTDNDLDGQYAEDWIGGVDLNRNYDLAWQYGNPNPQSEIYRGPSAFSEPETDALRVFVSQHDFKYAFSFHSGAELILYPWGYTWDPPPDETKFTEIARDLSDITGGTEYMQSSYLYFSYGLWEDWMYGVQQIPAFTCEIFVNDTWEGVYHPGPYPNTVWEGGLKYVFNPFPSAIETTILRWLPVFFYIANRSIFEAPIPILTVTASGSGTTNPAPGIHRYAEGQTVSIQAMPNVGSFLDHWELDGVNIGPCNPVNVLMHENHVLHAVFAQKSPGHDVAIKYIACKTVVGQGYLSVIKVVAMNVGSYAETFNVAVHIETFSTHPQVVALSSGNYQELAFTWNTTGFAKGNYMINATADIVPDEINATDNTYPYGNVTVAMIGDITGPTPSVPDGKVDIRDVATVAIAFGSYPDDAKWNLNADITGPIKGMPDDKVDIRDIATVAKNFGRIDP